MTTASTPIVDSMSTRGGRWNMSTQTDVSTRYTGSPTPAGRFGGLRPVGAHLAQIALPEPRAREFEDAAGSRPTDEFGERPIHRLRVGPLAAEPQRLLKQLLIEHKVRAFHAYMLQPGARTDQAAERILPRATPSSSVRRPTTLAESVGR